MEIIYGLLFIVGVVACFVCFSLLVNYVTNPERLCKNLGHQFPVGWGGGLPYLSQRGGAIDGIDRFHIDLIAACPRCNTEYVIAKTHHKTVKQLLPKHKHCWHLDGRGGEKGK